CCGAFEPLPCLGGEGGQPRQLRQPRGLAVSRGGLLYVVDTGNRRVQVFSIKGLALTTILGPLDSKGRSIASTPAMPAGATDCRPEASFADGTWDPFDI